MKKFRLILVGDIILPEDIDKIFSSDNRFLISNTLGSDYYFEMTGESTYCALKELEESTCTSLREYKTRIVDAIINRIEICGGKLLHKSLSFGYDTEFRSCNSAIRTLLMALNDGYSVEKYIQLLVNFQFKFYFLWKDGFWFCHDSSEINGHKPLTHIRTECLSKSKRNTLTLNTHFDSLNTLLLLKKYTSIFKFDFDIDIDYFILKGTISIDQLLNLPHKSAIGNQFQIIDNIITNKIDSLNGFIPYIYNRIINPVIFKFMLPTIFYENGFITRDLSVLNRHLDYMLVNTVDIARFLLLFNSYNCIPSCFNYNLLLHKVFLAFNYIQNNKYINYSIKFNSLQASWYAELVYILSNLDKRYYNIARDIYGKSLYCSFSQFYNINFKSN